MPGAIVKLLFHEQNTLILKASPTDAARRAGRARKQARWRRRRCHDKLVRF